MKIRHALCKLLPAPPVLSPDERYPVASPDHTGWMVIPRVAHRIRASESAAPVSAGWAYCKWRYFIAHVLVVGWPRLSKTPVARKSGLAGTGHETVPLDCPPEGSSKGGNDTLRGFVAALSKYVDELNVPTMIAKARGYPPGSLGQEGLLNTNTQYSHCSREDHQAVPCSECAHGRRS